jgi:hypothetical protein
MVNTPLILKDNSFSTKVDEEQQKRQQKRLPTQGMTLDELSFLGVNDTAIFASGAFSFNGVEVHGNIHDVGIVVVDQNNHQLVGVTINIAFNGFAPHVATVTVVVDPVATGQLASQLIKKNATSVLRVTGLQTTDSNIINKVLSGLQLFEEDLSTINFSATDSSGEKAFSLDLVALVGSDPNVTTKNIKLRADFSFSADILLNGTIPSTTNYFYLH